MRRRQPGAWEPSLWAKRPWQVLKQMKWNDLICLSGQSLLAVGLEDGPGGRDESKVIWRHDGATEIGGADSPSSCAIPRPLGVKGKGRDVGICWRRELGLLPLCCLSRRAYFWEGVCSESREEVATPLERICHPAFQLKYQIESVLLHGQQGWNSQLFFFFFWFLFFFLRERLYERTWCLRAHNGKKDKGKVAS